GNRPAELGGEGGLDIVADALAPVSVHLVGQGVHGGGAVHLGEPTRLVEGLRTRAELSEHTVAPRQRELVASRQLALRGGAWRRLLGRRRRCRVAALFGGR